MNTFQTSLPSQDVAKSVRYLGTSDDVTTCDCCGRKDLKSTVALSIDDADPVYFGVICAAKALRTSGKAVVDASRRADREKAEKEAAVRREEFNRRTCEWFSYVRERGAGDDDFRRIESLGGYAAARKSYFEWKAGREALALPGPLE